MTKVLVQFMWSLCQRCYSAVRDQILYAHDRNRMVKLHNYMTFAWERKRECRALADRATAPWTEATDGKWKMWMSQSAFATQSRRVLLCGLVVAQSESQTLRQNPVWCPTWFVQRLIACRTAESAYSRFYRGLSESPIQYSLKTRYLLKRLMFLNVLTD